MNAVIVLVISLGLAIHIFEVTMQTGATQANLGVKRIAAYGLLFGSIQIVMMMVGLLLTYLVEHVWKIHMISRVYHLVIFGVLFWIMVNEFWRVLKRNRPQERLEERMSVQTWVLLAVQSGVEAIVLGTGIYFFDPRSWAGLTCVLGFSLLAPILGLQYGYRRGFMGRQVMCIINGITMGIIAFIMIL